ncbi:MAG: lipoyl(octanoyl) transferase LipB [Spirochaetes bacterium]|nr:lipoyl(octanoyl) transferase LipB [Spirochaetota bacterium]
MNLHYCDLGRVSYRTAWQLQESLRRQRIEGRIPDMFLLLEHPPVITLGRRATERDILLDPEKLRSFGVEVIRIDRGGEVTYHGPGQLVGYLIFHLAVTKGSIKQFVHLLEEALIRALSHWGIDASRHPSHRGVWIGPDKIAALGLSVSRQVTTHGFALNVSTDLSAFQWIVPCGMKEAGVTSMESILKRSVKMEEVKPILLRALIETFGFSDSSVVDIASNLFLSQLKEIG